MIKLFKAIFNVFRKKKKPSRVFVNFGKDDFLGNDLPFYYDEMSGGIGINGASGAGKTIRILLQLVVRLLELRLSQPEDEKWGAVFIDPKLSFAAKLIGLIKYAGMGDELYVLSENESVTINPLMSGLSGQKIAEFIVKSLHAGKPMSVGSGAAYYESRAQALLGHIINVALEAKNPCLRLVSEMIDVLTSGGSVGSANPKAAESLKRIQVFMLGEEKERKMVLDSVQNYIEPFRNDPWRAIFFEPGPFTLDTIRDEGRLLVTAFSPNKVSNLASGLFLLKQLFYATIMDRQTTGFAGNKHRLCLFVVDEFQQVASGNSDSEFLAVRREAKCCPIFAFQLVSQLRTVIPNEWETVLGLLNTKIFLRQADPDTAAYAEKLGGFLESSVDAVTTAPDSLNLFYSESSRTTTRQLHPSIPADYFLSLPDGDAIVISDKRYMAWFPAAGMTTEEEITWRKERWPHRPHLVHPHNFRK